MFVRLIYNLVMGVSKTSCLGTLGELAVISHLLKQGYEIFQEVTNSSDIDLIALKNGKFIRIQVKTRTTKHGAVVAPRYHSGREIKRQVQGHEFDVLALYFRDKDLCLFINIDELVKISVGLCIRLEPAKNGQKKNVHWYENYC